MAKIKEAKKKSLKVRKQIRRTFGALFMASAIVVAAIPVDNIEAGDKSDAVTSDPRGNAAYDVVSNGDDDINFGSFAAPTDSSKIHTSYMIRKLSNGSWSYNWQFKYFIQNISGSDRAIISEYNSTYPETTVVLSNSANAGYYTVDAATYTAFYATGAGSTEYKFNYADYETYRASLTLTSNMQFLEKYRKESYDAFIALCAAYYQWDNVDDPTWQAEWDIWDAGTQTDPEPIKPVEPTKPTEISVKPSDFTEGEKLKYYCDLAEKSGDLPGEGYTLVAVTNNTGTGTEGLANTIYIAQGGKPVGTVTYMSPYNDANGFLVTKASTEVIGIGENAFSGISNVDYLTIPEEIKYIGDEAFIGSFIKSIDIKNVENIGNRAFKNCTELSSITMAGTKMVGAESFYNSGITAVTFPYSVSRVGPGAFAECKKLASVNFSSVNTTCVVDRFAFYNCYALNSVNMADSAIASIGEGAFALRSSPTGSWTAAVLPTSITGNNLGDYLFEGRSNLLSVTMPNDYGTSAGFDIPYGMFRNCRNLQFVEFPNMGTSGYVSFKELLFLDVTNKDFYVKGPEKSPDGKTARPRTSTWKAFSIGSDTIPYVYKDSNGVLCYEVSDGTYILQANETGQLTSCTLVDPTDTSTPIKLVIPSKVGNYVINSVSSDCFSDTVLKGRIVSITIEDNSLTTLGAGVFADLPNLTTVTVGNSVQSIGANAFLNCPKLTDVTFHTPLIGHDNFTIGNDAFKTGSSALTLHGDIISGYAPFEFATGKDSGKIDDTGRRICYKSLSPDYLTVMYDNKSGEVTLLEYPKYGNLDSEHGTYLKSMENYYYDKYGSAATGYDGYRKQFYDAVINGEMTLQEAYNSTLYGPWIDSDYVNAIDVSGNLLGMKAFYDQNPYSIIGNYERGAAARGDFEAVTDTELQWINGTLNIVIPAGITSIDAKGFLGATENSRNVTTYFTNRSSNDYIMATQDGTEKGDDYSVSYYGGLFSGKYQDYTPRNTTLEKYIKGNDRILSVIMSTVKSLPDYAFDSCERLQTVVLGSACEDIGTAPFRGCSSLTTITGNDYYVADKGIVYSVNPDGTYTIEECLASRGNLVGNSYIDVTTDPAIAKVSAITPGAFEDCDYLTKIFLTGATNLKIIPKDCFNDCDKLQGVDLPESIKRIESNAFGGNESVSVTIPGQEVYIATDAFEHVNTNTIITYKDTSAYDYAVYYGLDIVLLDGKFKVDFLDYDGTSLCDTQYVTEGKNAVPPDNPVREGHTFTGWLPTNYINVQSSLIVVAQYTSNTSDENKLTVTFYNYDDTVASEQKVAKGDSAVAPIPKVRSGYDFTGWKPVTYTNVQENLNIFAQFEKSDSSGSSSPSPSGSSSSSSASPSPTASGTSSSSSDTTTKYTASVSGGSGSGSYAAGTVVTISAYATGDGNVFDRWTTASTGVGFLDATSPTTTFTMPASNVTITATYKTSLSSSSGTGSVATNASGNDSTTQSGGGTTVEITKPGIPNTDLASANVNGSLDNFVVKITDDASATAAAVEALQKEYGDLTSIRYLPMDITLYDSTGTTKITDTAGLSVDITLPLPTDLVSYAGNNMVASVAGGNLERLGSKFTTIDGIPCVSFTATHFSPYVIYVDTENLTEGITDVTPKTGDFLHPKWFLVIGLASIAMILFLKKDSVSTVKPA